MKSRAKQNPRPPRDFVRIITDGDRETFKERFRSPRWWESGKLKTWDQGWNSIFESNDWRCIYCGIDLITSADALAASTEEHLVPASLATDKKAVNFPTNMAPCCSGCNVLKGDYVPAMESEAWNNRNAYVAEW